MGICLKQSIVSEGRTSESMDGDTRSVCHHGTVDEGRGFETIESVSLEYRHDRGFPISVEDCLTPPQSTFPLKVLFVCLRDFLRSLFPPS